MSIEVLSRGGSSTAIEQFTYLVDYDTVAQTIGLTCTGTGHSELAVQQTSNGNVLGSLNCDQYGSSAGQLTNGASNAPVSYDGTRRIVLGPGATGVDSTGKSLPSAAVSASVVGAFNVPRGQTPGLNIAFGWSPNANAS